MNKITYISMVLFASLLLIGCIQTGGTTNNAKDTITSTDQIPATELEENITLPTPDLPEIVDPINESEGDFPDLI